MKTMNMKATKMKFRENWKTSAALSGVLAIAALLMFIAPKQAVAQEAKKSYSDIEKTQDKIEALYIDVYNVIDRYPQATYRYVHENGDVTKVIIEGIPENKDKKMLEVSLIDLENLKKEIFNMSNRMGVYYAAETEPEPKMGYKDFYASLRNNMSYPEQAKENSVEGFVFVKFIVDANGNIGNVYASENIDTSFSSAKDAMKKEAKAAVKATSGQWTPAKIGGIAVPQWVVLPVQFKLESPFFVPLY